MSGMCEEQQRGQEHCNRVGRGNVAADGVGRGAKCSDVESWLVSAEEQIVIHSTTLNPFVGVIIPQKYANVTNQRLSPSGDPV